MLKDESFEVESMEVPARYDRKIQIIPLGDIHYGSESCHIGKFRQIVKWIKDKPYTYVIGMGDYTDLMRTHDRIAIRNSSADSSRQILDMLARKDLDQFLKELMPIKDRILGLGEGNHRWDFESGITSTQYLCDRLNTKYLGYMSYFMLRLKFETKTTSRLSVVFLIHHGFGGGGRLAGTTINRVERLEKIADADVYMMGHDHQKGVRTLSKLVLDRSGVLHDRKRLLVSTGSYLKSYMPNQPNYAVKNGYAPADLGCAKIILIPKRDTTNKTDRTWVDLHASV